MSLNKRFIIAAFCVYLIAIDGITADASDFGSNGVQILAKVVRQYLNSQTEDLRIGEGVHLVSTKTDVNGRSNTKDSSIIDMIETYLKSHEVRIKLPELMPKEGFGRALKYAMEGFEAGNEIGTPRGKGGGGFGGGGKGKGDGGFGAVALMGLMMGKMMAALGMGGVGLLAMKALMVSALALMLSVIVGLKKLLSQDHDDGGGHTVIHASPSHGGGGGWDHRRKRAAADMAYHSYNDYQNS